MFKKFRKIFYLIIGCLLIVVTAGCDSDVIVEKNKTRRPIQEIDFNLGAGSGSQVLVKDKSGLFSTSLAVKEISYNQNIPSIYADIENYSYGKKGVKFDANISGAQIYYNKVLDLNEINENVITFEVLHNDNSKITEVMVELIDIYDPAIKVGVNWSYISAEIVTDMVATCNSVSAGGNNVSPDEFGKPRLQYGATNYLSNLFEQVIPWYGSGKEHSPFHFRYDINENQIRADVGIAGNQRDFLILDVDSAIHMGDDTFKGFTTGEVYLKLTVADLNAQGSVVITSIGGKSLAGETLTSQPTNSIKVKLENKSYAIEMPNGQVGSPYLVPSVDNIDLIRGEYKVSMMVKAPTGESVNIENNKFIPTVVGNYKIIYSARDINNFIIEKNYNVLVKTKIEDINITTSYEEGYVFLTNKALKLPKAEVTGGSGILKNKISYLFNDIAIEADTNGNYIFEKSGTLKVLISSVDYLGNTATKQFVFAVKLNPEIKLLSALPTGVQANTVFKLPDFIVKNAEDSTYNNKIITINGNILLSRDFTVPESGNLIIEYRAGLGESELLETYNVSIIKKISNEDVSSLFMGSGSMTTSQLESGVKISASSNDNVMNFAHPISAVTTEIYLRDTAETGFDYIEITLTDAFDSSKKVAFRLYNSTNLTESFRIQDAKGSYDIYKYPLLSSITVPERKHFYYENSDQTIYNVNLGKIAQIKYYTDGSVFNGFKSGVLTLSIKFGGVKNNGAGLIFAKLGNQQFDLNALSYGDLISPQLAPIGRLVSGNYAYNSEFVVPAANAVDILSLGSTIEVYFTSPSGEKILNGEDCTDSRSYILNKIGNYTLVYKVEDSNGAVNNWRFNITVKDFSEPEIVINGNYFDVYNVGDSIKLITATVTDNVDASNEIYTYILIAGPKYEYNLHKPGDTFTFDMLGYYKLQYCARDSAGNYGIVVFTVTVE